MVLSLVAVSISAAPKADKVGQVASGYTPEGTGIASLAEITDPAGKYYLTKDITVSETFATEFTGTFDGNGKTITTSVALFNKVKDATIKNIIVKGEISISEKAVEVGTNDFYAVVAVIANGKTTFTNILSDVNVTSTYSNTRVAAIAATTDTANYELTFDTCVNKGDISVKKYAGGIYAWTNKSGVGVIKNCANYGNISSTGGYIAGIASRMSGGGGSLEITDTANYGKVETTSQHASGFIAYHDEAPLTFKNCVNEGEIKGASYGAGFVSNTTIDGAASGKITSIEVTYENCTNKGNVTAGSAQASGFAANIEFAASKASLEGNVVFNNCVNTGKIVGVKSTAGIAANVKFKSAESTIKITNCTNRGEIDATAATANDQHAAGILAYCNYTTTISHCLNYGDVKSSTAFRNFAGGIAGKPGTNSTTIVIEYCGNYGHIYGGSNTAVANTSGTGGITGYIFGGKEGSTTMRYCFNAGTVEAVSAAASAGGLIGFTNTAKQINIQYNYNAGDVVLANESTGLKYDLFYNNEATLNLDGVKGNMQREGQVGYIYNAGASSENTTTFATADLASGKLCHDLNEAIGENVFKQTLGKDAVPSFTGKTVLKNADGTYSNPETPATGDMTVVLFLVAVATLGSAVVIGKKVSVR